MALVSYGSSDEGSSDEDMDTDQPTVTIVPKLEPKKTIFSSDGLKTSTSEQVNNSEAFVNVSSTFLKFDILPQPQESLLTTPDANFPEEIGPIPPKKIYDEAEIEKPPGRSRNNDNITRTMASSSSFASSLTAQKVRGVMKISAPSLKDFMDDDEEDSNSTKPKSRIIQPSKKGSGLFAVLPEPKQGASFYDPVKKNANTAVKLQVIKDDDVGTIPSASGSAIPSSSSSSADPGSSKATGSKSLIPHAVQQALLGKRPVPTKLDEIKSKYLKQEANVRIVSRGGKNKKKDDSDDSDEESGDFFSFAAANEVIPEDPSLRIPEYVPPPPTQSNEADSGEMEESSSSSYELPVRPQASVDVMSYVQKEKKGSGPINFIDVSADDLRPESQEWLKQVSAEAPVQKRNKNAPGGMQKRKHQITYLAFQAKEMEQELKNQWSQNKQSKRMTQSKYGF